MKHTRLQPRRGPITSLSVVKCVAMKPTPSKEALKFKGSEIISQSKTARPPLYQQAPSHDYSHSATVAYSWHLFTVARESSARGVTTGIGPQPCTARQHAFCCATETKL